MQISDQVVLNSIGVQSTGEPGYSRMPPSSSHGSRGGVQTGHGGCGRADDAVRAVAAATESSCRPRRTMPRWRRVPRESLTRLSTVGMLLGFSSGEFAKNPSTACVLQLFRRRVQSTPSGSSGPAPNQQIHTQNRIWDRR